MNGNAPTVHEEESVFEGEYAACVSIQEISLEHSYFRLDVKNVKSLCNELCSNIKSVEEHRKFHERPFKCEHCSRSFRKKSVYVEHLRVHTGEKPFKCNICERSFAQASGLFSHSSVHYGPRPHYCTQCRMTFRTQSQLQKHKRFHKRTKLSYCPNCSKSFLTRSQLNKHMVTHADVKPFQCDICLKRYTQKVNLSLHMSLHGGTKAFECKECGKLFRLEKYLMVHKRSHLVPFRNTCKFCNELFDDAEKLQAHVVEHSGPKPYYCNVCGESFSLRVKLNSHLSSHEITGAINCLVCETSFPSVEDLECHSCSQLPAKVYSCNTCEKTFKSCLSLLKHMKVLKHFTSNQDQASDLTPEVLHNYQPKDSCDEFITFKNTIWQPLEENNSVDHTSNVIKHSNLFKCKDCPEIFKEFKNLVKHSVKHGVHSEQELDPKSLAIFKCGECSLIFERLDLLETHYHCTHMTDSDFVLNWTNMDEFIRKYKEESVCLKDAETLVGDKENSNGIVEYLDDFISTDDIFKNRVSAAADETTDSYAENGYEEENDPDESSNVGIFDESPKPITVPQPEKEDLKNGTELHHCNYCGADFSQQSELEVHVQEHIFEENVSLKEELDQNKKKLYVCAVCGNSFPTPSCLSVHARVHTVEVPLNCESCGMLYARKEDLEWHKRYIHSDSHKFICKICDKTFESSSLLKDHLGLHLDVKLHKCKICSKTFSQFTQLRLHMTKSHKSLVNCEKCGMKYKLKRGPNKHTLGLCVNDKRSLSCQYCGRKFAFVATLVNHMKTHSDVNRYACELCDLSFRLRRQLKFHVLCHMENFDETKNVEWEVEYLSEDDSFLQNF